MRVHGGLLNPRGHAIECRITAEDPFGDFLPATGVVRQLRVPGGPGVRWDGGVETGNEVTRFYDPLLGKLVAWGETREIAIQRMRRALRELVIVGLPTSQAFHLRVMDDPAFERGEIDVTYVDRLDPTGPVRELPPDLVRPLAITAALLADMQRTRAVPPIPAATPTLPGGPSPWVTTGLREGLRE
jgi:acetyl-CoA carboxylase biotin carboxylase subunit